MTRAAKWLTRVTPDNGGRGALKHPVKSDRSPQCGYLKRRMSDIQVGRCAMEGLTEGPGVGDNCKAIVRHCKARAMVVRAFVRGLSDNCQSK